MAPKNTDRLIVVSGATGQQGGAVARHLLQAGWRVRALTRDAASDKAQALKQQGAEVVQADLADRASLDAAVAGAYGVFSVQNFWLPGVGAEGEVQQGNNLADAAQAAGVKHFVFTSVGSADNAPGIQHFDSKAEIERHIQTLGLPATILRPVFFMDNLNWSRPFILSGQYTGMGLRTERTMQMIAVEDIGAVVAEIFAQPEEFIGQTIELAGDELSEAQTAAALAKVIGRPVQLAAAVGTGSAPNEEQVRMVRWFNEVGYVADIPALRKRFPTLHNFEQYLRANGWENAEPVPLPAQAAWGS